MVRITFTDGRPGVQTETFGDLVQWLHDNYPDGLCAAMPEGIAVYRDRDGWDAGERLTGH